MAAIGSVWSPNTWIDDAWGLGTWGDAVAPVLDNNPPSPTRLIHDHVNGELHVFNHWERLLFYEPVNTALTVLDADGVEMASNPLIITAGETAPIPLKCAGADGSPEDLSTAQSVTLRVATPGGTAVVNGVALIGPSSAGTAVWYPQASEVATPGDYLYQVKVVRLSGTIGYYPDGQRGNPLTILPTV